MATYAYQTTSGQTATIQADTAAAALDSIGKIGDANPHSGVAEINAPSGTGSPIGSSAGVQISQNTQTATQAATASVAAPAASTGGTGNTTSPGGSGAGGTAPPPGFTSNTTPTGTPISTNAQNYIETNTTAGQTEYNASVTQANNDYNTAVATLQASLQQQTSDLTDQMNTEVQGTQAELLAANPYASPNDPNIQGYLDNIKSNYQDQINDLQENVNGQITTLTQTKTDAITQANSQWAGLQAQIQSQGYSMAESDYKDYVASSKDAQSEFISTANTFPFQANQDVGSMTMGDFLNTYQDLFSAAGIDTSQLGQYSNMSVSDFQTLGGSLLDQTADGAGTSFNGVLSAVTNGTQKATQDAQSQDRIDISEATSAAEIAHTNAETDKILTSISGGGTTSLTKSQISKGSNNAGLSTTSFSNLDPEVQNFYAHAPSTTVKALNANLALVKSGKASVSDFEAIVNSAGYSSAVTYYLNGLGQSSAPAQQKPDTSSIGSWWSDIVNGFNSKI